MAFEQTEYDAEIQRRKWKERLSYALAVFLRGVFYIIKLFLTVIWGGVKGVLQTFGVPIR